MTLPRPLSPVAFDDDRGVRERLALAHIALVGCGGLGSNAAEMLVRSGVGELTLIDFDVVDESNLNRQRFFRDQLGEPKPLALAESLLRINPDVRLNLHCERATPDNLLELLGDPDVVIEAADRADVKAMVANVLLRDRPETPLVSASGLAGFGSANEITCERVGENFYLAGDLCSDVRDSLPLLSSRVMVAAAHEAHAAIRICLGYPEP